MPSVPLDTTFKAPRSVSAAALRAKRARDGKPPSQQGMTPVGLARMNQLIRGDALSLRTVRRMLGYFSRHLPDKQGSTWDDRGKGWQAWHGWGGDPGARWAVRTVRQNDVDWFNKWAKAPRNKALLRHLQR